jgi:hypothetical protein
MTPPQYPAGPLVPEQEHHETQRRLHLEVLAMAPALLREAVAGLTAAQLDTKYKNWTVRQIVHHLADSHINAYVRFKLALTEEQPTIKPYDETRWSELEEARTGDIAVSLGLLEALHGRWVRLLRLMTPAEFERSFFHPESGEQVPLYRSLGVYAWHCRHHIGQIEWLRAQHGWKK